MPRVRRDHCFLSEIAAGLPEGVTIQAVYDRSDLRH
jgi:Cu/Ag efflux pump CusA